MIANVIARYQNRSIETAQVMEELVEMAKKFREAASRGEALGLTEDDVRFYDALANNESAVRELTDETLKKIAHKLTETRRQNLAVDRSERASVRAKFRLMVKRVLRKYKYPLTCKTLRLNWCCSRLRLWERAGMDKAARQFIHFAKNQVRI